MEHERTANAVLLFYEKAVPREESITGDGSAEGGHANAPQEEVVEEEKKKPVTVSGGSRQGVVGGGEVLTLGASLSWMGSRHSRMRCGRRTRSSY